MQWPAQTSGRLSETGSAQEVGAASLVMEDSRAAICTRSRDEAKLSRLKTHRILARFAERGIVTLKKIGNTNEVTIAEWLR